MHAERQEEAHGEGDAEYVVDACPDEVAAHGGEDGAGEVEGCDDVEEVGPHEDDVGRFDGDGGAGGEGNAHRCGDKRG